MTGEETLFEIFTRDDRFFIRRPDCPPAREAEITFGAIKDLGGHLLRYQEDFRKENGTYEQKPESDGC